MGLGQVDEAGYSLCVGWRGLKTASGRYGSTAGAVLSLLSICLLLLSGAEEASGQKVILKVPEPKVCVGYPQTISCNYISGYIIKYYYREKGEASWTTATPDNFFLATPGEYELKVTLADVATPSNVISEDIKDLHVTATVVPPVLTFEPALDGAYCNGSGGLAVSVESQGANSWYGVFEKDDPQITNGVQRPKVSDSLTGFAAGTDVTFSALAATATTYEREMVLVARYTDVACNYKSAPFTVKALPRVEFGTKLEMPCSICQEETQQVPLPTGVKIGYNAPSPIEGITDKVALTYSWELDGVLLTGATLSELDMDAQLSALRLNTTKLDHEYKLKTQMTYKSADVCPVLEESFAVHVTPKLSGNTVLPEKLVGRAEANITPASWASAGLSAVRGVVCPGVQEVSIAGSAMTATAQLPALGGGNGDLTYSWLQDGTPLAGAIAAGYSGQVELGKQYKRVVTSGGCALASNSVEYVEDIPLSATLTKLDVPYCAGGTEGKLGVEVTRTGNVGYDGTAWPLSPEASADAKNKPLRLQLIKDGVAGGEKSVKNWAAGTPLKSDFAGLGNGRYQVKLVDAYGCETLATPEIALEAKPLELKHDTIIAVSCPGKDDGAVKLSWTGEPLPAGVSDKYILSVQGETPGSRDFTDLSCRWDMLKQGHYTFQVSRGSNCHSSKLGVEVPAAESLEVVKVSTLAAKCADDKSGVVEVEVVPADKTGVDYILQDPATHAVLDKFAQPHFQVGKGEYELVCAYGSGCLTAPESVKVEGPEPIAVTLASSNGGAKLGCPSDKVVLTATLTGGVAPFTGFEWKSSRMLELLRTHEPTLEKAQAGKYSVTAIDANGCRGTSGVLEVASNYPVSYKIVPKPATCSWEGDMASPTRPSSSVDITVTKGAYTEYAVKLFSTLDTVEPLAEPTASLGELHLGGSNTLSLTLPAGAYYIRSYATIYDPLKRQCEYDEPFTITGDPANEVGIAITPIPQICAEQPLKVNLALTNEAAGGDRVTKVFYRYGSDDQLEGDLELDEGTGAYKTDYGLIGRTMVHVTAKSPQGCISKDSLVVEASEIIRSSLAVDVPSSDVNIFAYKHWPEESRRYVDKNGKEYVPERDYTVFAMMPGIPSTVASSLSDMLGTGGYKFEPEGIFQPVEGDPNKFQVLVDANTLYSSENREGHYVVTKDFAGRNRKLLRTRVSVENHGCVETVDVYFNILEQLRIPNVFTPNGDGINDRWLCNGDPEYRNLYTNLQKLIPDMQVEVFNRTGMLVWKAKGEEIAKGWDGTTYSGKAELPLGTYYYVIKFNHGDQKGWEPKTGSVTIVR